MLQEAETTPQLKEWIDRLAPVVEESKEILQRRRPSKLVTYSGCEQGADGSFRLAFFWHEYLVSAQNFTIRRAEDGNEPSSFIQSLILTYLATANGTTPSGRWIGFRDLPDGMFYAQAFRGYTGIRLIRQLEGGIEAFRRAAEALDGKPIEGIGDAGYAFGVLPRLRIGVVYWQGDEEFPPQSRVLFEDSAANYMPTDGLAILGSHLVGYILKAAQ
ncbi:MAG: DUF3786 domain-containing protein [Anaerolineae bacterium]|jgi:hypothetical protein